MEQRPTRRNRWQSGQALIEYSVIIPVGITAILAGVAIGTWVKSSLSDTVNVVGQPESAEVIIEDAPLALESETCKAPEATFDGPENATGLSRHAITFEGYSYNAGSDETTIIYQVTSDGKPPIAYWVWAPPSSVESGVIGYSENISGSGWKSDKNTGLYGAKFAKGYPTGGETRQVSIVLSGEYNFGPVSIGVKTSSTSETGYITGPISQLVNPCAS